MTRRRSCRPARASRRRRSAAAGRAPAATISAVCRARTSGLVSTTSNVTPRRASPRAAFRMPRHALVGQRPLGVVGPRVAALLGDAVANQIQLVGSGHRVSLPAAPARGRGGVRARSLRRARHSAVERVARRACSARAGAGSRPRATVDQRVELAPDRRRSAASSDACTWRTRSISTCRSCRRPSRSCAALQQPQIAASTLRRRLPSRARARSAASSAAMRTACSRSGRYTAPASSIAVGERAPRGARRARRAPSASCAPRLRAVARPRRSSSSATRSSLRAEPRAARRSAASRAGACAPRRGSSRTAIADARQRRAADRGRTIVQLVDQQRAARRARAPRRAASVTLRSRRPSLRATSASSCSIGSSSRSRRDATRARCTRPHIALLDAV